MTVRIRDIVASPLTLGPDTQTSAAKQLFIASPDLLAIPVVCHGAPLGLLMRSDIMELFASASYAEAALNMPITRFMDANPFLSDISAPAAYIARKIHQKNGIKTQNGVIATEDGRYAGYVSSLRLLETVSEENAARAEAMQANMTKLEKARQESIDLRREQARFMAFLGHEIRTPLTGILGIADLLGDRKLEPEARDYARTISECGQHLDRLLGDFLDLSRLAVGKLSLVPTSFKLADFVKDTRMLWSARAGQKGVQLNVTHHDGAVERIEADATRLRQILFNLVGNAVKFTPRGSVSVHVQTRRLAGSAFCLEMTVSDTGIGIADRDKARLFEAFEQASLQTVHRYGGTGLGLSIAKALVEQMGGQIRLTDNPGGGSVFHVSCPVLKAGPRLAVENKTQRRSANLKLGRILLVEDHDVSQLVICEALRAIGWTVDAVATAEQGLTHAERTPYQAILSDLHLGEVSGVQLVQRIRIQSGPNQHCPILAVTADVSAARVRQCEKAGFSGFIEKPIRPRNLVATLIDTLLFEASYKANQVQIAAV